MDNIDELLHAKLSHFGWTVEAIFALILAAVSGGLVGLERELRGRQAGFRTNVLVCVGSALVMIVSNQVALMTWPHQPNVSINIDPARIAYGVMGGIGFLGVCTIVLTRGSVRGLTTAAGLWCVAALGLAAGLRMYVVTVAASILVLIVLWVLDYFENLLPTTHYRTISIRCRWEPGAITKVVDWLKSFRFKIIDVNFERRKDLDDVDVDLRVSFRRKKALYELEHKAQGEQDFHLMAIRQP